MRLRRPRARKPAPGQSIIDSLMGGVVAPGHNLLVQPVLLVLISVVFRLLPYQFILPLLPQLLVKIHQVLLMLLLGALN